MNYYKDKLRDYMDIDEIIKNNQMNYRLDIKEHLEKCKSCRVKLKFILHMSGEIADHQKVRTIKDSNN